MASTGEGAESHRAPLARRQLCTIFGRCAKTVSAMSSSKPTATLRSRPEDFVVEELAAYEPSGEGTHLFVTFRKTGHNTHHAVRLLAEALGVDAKGAGTAGMKDRHAVTTQRASFPFPVERDPSEAMAVAIDGIEVLEARRHPHKLKTGHLRGNRFTIVLRDLAAADAPSAEAALARVAREGVPNRFGRQRFGREGDNAERARRFLVGDAPPPRDRKKQRFLFSAWQSALFNEIVERRIAAGTLATVLAGDLAKKHDTGGVFLVVDDEPELEDARRRAAEGLLSATGPMFGAKMKQPAGEVAAMERAVLEAALPDVTVLERYKKLGKGTRRPLRLWVDDLSWDHNPALGSLTVRFVLPQGGYATTVLAEAFDLVDATLERQNRDKKEDRTD